MKESREKNMISEEGKLTRQEESKLISGKGWNE